MREAGFRPPQDPSLAAKFQDLKYLEKSIGATGRRAIAPLIPRGSRDLWRMHMVREGPRQFVCALWQNSSLAPCLISWQGERRLSRHSTRLKRGKSTEMILPHRELVTLTPGEFRRAESCSRLCDPRWGRWPAVSSSCSVVPVWTCTYGSFRPPLVARPS